LKIRCRWAKRRSYDFACPAFPGCTRGVFLSLQLRRFGFGLWRVSMGLEEGTVVSSALFNDEGPGAKPHGTSRYPVPFDEPQPKGMRQTDVSARLASPPLLLFMSVKSNRRAARRVHNKVRNPFLHPPKLQNAFRKRSPIFAKKQPAGWGS